MTIWFVADTHLGKQPSGRRKITGLSGAELDALICERWVSLVAEEDEVWHLGDIGPDLERLAKLPGREHLINGNDDPPLKVFQDGAIFTTARKRFLLQAAEHALFLIHIPGEAPADPGGFVVHGHTHHLDPAPGYRSVSVDRTNWAPITLAELMEREA